MSDAQQKLTGFQIATSHSVIRRAFRIALVVGIVLALINYGDRIVAGTLGVSDAIRIALTFLVPYVVSTVSSILAVRDHEQVVEPPQD